jgi:hypothetical protein
VNDFCVMIVNHFKYDFDLKSFFVFVFDFKKSISR